MKKYKITISSFFQDELLRSVLADYQKKNTKALLKAKLNSKACEQHLFWANEIRELQDQLPPLN